MLGFMSAKGKNHPVTFSLRLIRKELTLTNVLTYADLRDNAVINKSR